MSDSNVTSASATGDGADTHPTKLPHDQTFMQRCDAWMAANPWHPRIAPFMVYLLLMFVVNAGRDHLSPWMFPLLYGVQCGAVGWLMWRYRHLLPELNLKFHWSAIPAGVLVFVTWVALAYAMMSWFPAMQTEGYRYFDEMSPVLAWLSLILRLIGMALIVPLFEELWIRSLLLRSLHSPRWTAIGVVNLAQDIPMLDDMIGDTQLARKAGRHHEVFSKQFFDTPLGKLSIFGILASTFVFTLGHGMRDWPACLVCGIIYCLVVGYTNTGKRQMGLGPVIWAHGITNAMLWAYALQIDEQYFLP